MHSRTLTGKLVIASHNPGKIREIDDLIAPFGLEAISAGALGLPEPEETGTSFAANAELKAVAAAIGANLPALADDSGLVVPALDGAPGIYSARWAGPQKDFSVAMARVEQELGDRTALAQRNGSHANAYFVCALALAWPDGSVEVFEGRVEGELTFPPRGDRGFGYDPIFLPQGDSRTFGEMPPAEKHAISHRARAFAQLKRRLEDLQ
ncbi:RdgB/HAM1 family non-canonical purine NTP pyrophosphatase [Algihabitans albus]|uniref:RdgB/HAM1 family non-canonical purine NTP pyrophosphatase n=1 Tax=Algihabitans albus TaxID=2164067 RepID=UPI000E5CC8F8|nr:RdgB/HAM1 family non-canonical purine NTP pyrophosphatase [Algihabitans albus]